MAKQTEKKRDLMIQRINLSDAILSYWEKNLRKTLNLAIHKFLLVEDDIQRKFEVESETEKRIFSVEGLTDEEFIILKEYKQDNDIYWMCKYEYVQFLLKRFNILTLIKETIDKKTKIHKVGFKKIQKEYTDNQLYFPNKSARKKSVEQQPKEPIIKDDDFLFKDDDEDENFDYDEIDKEFLTNFSEEE